MDLVQKVTDKEDLEIAAHENFVEFLSTYEPVTRVALATRIDQEGTAYRFRMPLLTLSDTQLQEQATDLVFRGIDEDLYVTVELPGRHAIVQAYKIPGAVAYQKQVEALLDERELFVEYTFEPPFPPRILRAVGKKHELRISASLEDALSIKGRKDNQGAASQDDDSTPKHARSLLSFDVDKSYTGPELTRFLVADGASSNSKEYSTAAAMLQNARHNGKLVYDARGVQGCVKGSVFLQYLAQKYDPKHTTPKYAEMLLARAAGQATRDAIAAALRVRIVMTDVPGDPSSKIAPLFDQKSAYTAPQLIRLLVAGLHTGDERVRQRRQMVYNSLMNKVLEYSQSGDEKMIRGEDFIAFLAGRDPLGRKKKCLVDLLRLAEDTATQASLRDAMQQGGAYFPRAIEGAVKEKRGGEEKKEGTAPPRAPPRASSTVDLRSATAALAYLVDVRGLSKDAAKKFLSKAPIDTSSGDALYRTADLDVAGERLK